MNTWPNLGLHYGNRILSSFMLHNQTLLCMERIPIEWWLYGDVCDSALLQMNTKGTHITVVGWSFFCSERLVSDFSCFVSNYVRCRFHVSAAATWCNERHSGCNYTQHFLWRNHKCRHFVTDVNLTTFSHHVNTHNRISPVDSNFALHQYCKNVHVLPNIH